jgi:phosphate-selective porin
MPTVQITGAQFTVSVGATAYSAQVTSGTITTTPTVTRTKTLSGVAFDQTDLNSTISIEYLYDDNAGLYDALQTAITAGTALAVSVHGATGVWTGTAMWPDSADVKFDAAGIAMATVNLQGEMTFA